MSRPTWDEYFIEIAKLTSTRSNCIKRKVGSVLVKDNRILSLGYNGTPHGIKNCMDGGCDRCNGEATKGEKLDMCICIHAEENVLLFISKEELKDSTIYSTLLPCIGCAKKIVQCGVKRIVYLENYQPELDCLSISLMKSVGIQVVSPTDNKYAELLDKLTQFADKHKDITFVENIMTFPEKYVYPGPINRIKEEFNIQEEQWGAWNTFYFTDYPMEIGTNDFIKFTFKKLPARKSNIVIGGVGGSS